MGPFDRLESPWLLPQGVVPQSDDGVVVARGTIDAVPAVVLAIEGAFQGGSTGEVSGAKIAGALELCARDAAAGRPMRPVLVMETGGVRLQEANLGLAAVADIHAAIVDLRRHVPVVGVIAGMVGCFGGMSIAAGLCSHLIVTRQARLGLNGPEVIEQNAGIAELDSRDRALIWSLTGGEQRIATGFADELVEDDTSAIVAAVRAAVARACPGPAPQRGGRSVAGAAGGGRPELAARRQGPARHLAGGGEMISNETPSRGRTWFEALVAGATLLSGGPASVLAADAALEGEGVRFLAVVPDPASRFPRARQGELGLEEGWTLAARVREAIAADRDGTRRPIVAVVDVPSQAYGRNEELLGIHLACAAAADAYASARLAGHPVVALVVGRALSGAFLAHGYQANRVLALDDPGWSCTPWARRRRRG